MKTIPIIAFFNSRAGVGKTSLVYHLTYMFAELGRRVLAADFSPQADLTAALVDEDQLETVLWPSGGGPQTICQCIEPLLAGAGSLSIPRVDSIEDRIALLVGDPMMASLEDRLAPARKERSENKGEIASIDLAFSKVLHGAAEAHQAEIVLVDLASNLGVVNRLILRGVDFLLVPLLPDVRSVKAMDVFGPTLSRWRYEDRGQIHGHAAQKRRKSGGKLTPLGYVVSRPMIHLDRSASAVEKWLARIPKIYHENVTRLVPSAPTVAEDPACLALLKLPPLLVEAAQEVRKPIFRLKPADGAIGAQYSAVLAVRNAFEMLAVRIAKGTGLALETEHA